MAGRCQTNRWRDLWPRHPLDARTGEHRHRLLRCDDRELRRCSDCCLRRGRVAGNAACRVGARVPRPTSSELCLDGGRRSGRDRERDLIEVRGGGCIQRVGNCADRVPADRPRTGASVAAWDRVRGGVGKDALPRVRRRAATRSRCDCVYELPSTRVLLTRRSPERAKSHEGRLDRRADRPDRSTLRRGTLKAGCPRAGPTARAGEVEVVAPYFMILRRLVNLWSTFSRFVSLPRPVAWRR